MSVSRDDDAIRTRILDLQQRAYEDAARHIAAMVSEN